MSLLRALLLDLPIHLLDDVLDHSSIRQVPKEWKTRYNSDHKASWERLTRRHEGQRYKCVMFQTSIVVSEMELISTFAEGVNSSVFNRHVFA